MIGRGSEKQMYLSPFQGWGFFVATQGLRAALARRFAALFGSDNGFTGL